jgi:hypothetical protein
VFFFFFRLCNLFIWAEISLSHSTGRGGLANLTDRHTGIEEVDHHTPEISSTGRGGAGNIHGKREHSRGGSKERNSLGAFIDKVAHPHGHRGETVPEE